jgi:hypothetical protein
MENIPTNPNSAGEPEKTEIQPSQPNSLEEPSTQAGVQSDTQVGLAGSQMQPEKVKMPVGIYIIAGLSLLGFIAGFFDSSQSSTIYIIAMFMNLALAIGLIMRLQAARKLAIWLSGIILVITAASLLLLVGLQDRLHQRRADYEAAFSKIDRSKITSTQKQQLEAMSAAIATQEKKAGKAITFTYFKLGATSVECIAVIVYLTRPRVKAVFHGLEAQGNEDS